MDTSERLRSRLREPLRLGLWLDFRPAPGTRSSEWLVGQGLSVARAQEGGELAGEVAPGTIRPVQLTTDDDEPRLEHRPERVIQHVRGTSVFIGPPAATAELTEKEIRNISAIAYGARFSPESRLRDSYRTARPPAEICQIGDCAVPRSDSGRSPPRAPDLAELTSYQLPATIGQLRPETDLARKTQNA
jgi:hypothetical protein